MCTHTIYSILISKVPCYVSLFIHINDICISFSILVNIPGIAISLSVLAVMICCVIGTWISYSTRKRKTVATSRASRPVPPRTSPTAQTTVQEDGCTVTATSLPPNYDGSGRQFHFQY